MFPQVTGGRADSTSQRRDSTVNGPPNRPRWRVQIVRCGGCGKPRGLRHTCTRRLGRRPQRTRFKPQVRVRCGCGQLRSPFAAGHICRTDFKKRKRRQAAARRRARERRPAGGAGSGRPRPAVRRREREKAARKRRREREREAARDRRARERARHQAGGRDPQVHTAPRAHPQAEHRPDPPGTQSERAPLRHVPRRRLPAPRLRGVPAGRRGLPATPRSRTMIYLKLTAALALFVLGRFVFLLCAKAVRDCAWCAPKPRRDGETRPPWWAPWCVRCRGRREHFRLGARTARRIRVALINGVARGAGPPRRPPCGRCAVSCPGLHCPGCSSGQSAGIAGLAVIGLIIARPDGNGGRREHHPDRARDRDVLRAVCRRVDVAGSDGQTAARSRGAISAASTRGPTTSRPLRCEPPRCPPSRRR